MLRRLFLVLICCSVCGFGQSKRPFTFEDMMQLKRIGEPSVSPNSRWVAFSAVDVNLDANTKTPHLWIVPISGGEARRLTPADGKSEDRIRFSPDNRRILFESSRDGGSQIYVQRLRYFHRNGDRRTAQDHRHFDRGFRWNVVARRQEHHVCIIGISRLQRRCLQQAA